MPLADIVQETQRIVDGALGAGIVLRLFGGLAVKMHSPSAAHAALGRSYVDIDFMGLSKESKRIRAFFPDLGYTPREIFNALNGDRRLIFNDLENGRRVDVFLDVFQMCHRLEFKDRLILDEITITLADLLASKLQVVEISEREYRDVMALILDHEVASSDAPEVINGKYLARICAEDWGIYKTFSLNIGNIMKALRNYNLDAGERRTVESRLDALLKMIEGEPKSLAWKLRARIGEKVRWYELPEQDSEIVNSQITSGSR